MTTASSKRERQKARKAERRAAAEAAARRQGRARRARLAVIGLAVAAAVVGVAYLMAGGADATLGVPAAEVSGGAQPLPPPAEPAAEDAAAGAPPPEVTGSDPDGGTVRIGAVGRAQAITFIAHWCPHCQEEVPDVVEWAGAGNLPADVELVAVSTHHDPARPNWPPDEWLAREGWPGAVLVDHDLAATEAYGAQGTPFWVFVDADGTVAARHPGRLTMEQLTTYVDDLAGGG